MKENVIAGTKALTSIKKVSRRVIALIIIIIMIRECDVRAGCTER